MSDLVSRGQFSVSRGRCYNRVMIPPEEARVRTGGGEVHLDIYHHEGCRALLYLHPAGCYAGMFQEQLKRLTEAGFTVVAMDLPGHGRSGRKGDFTLLGAAQAVLSIGEWITGELGLRPGLWGSSLGGVIGSYVLVLDDERIFPAAVLHSPAATPEEVRGYSRFPRLFAELLKPYRWLEDHLIESLPADMRGYLSPLNPGRWKLPIPLFFNPSAGRTEISLERIGWAFAWVRHPLKTSCYTLRTFASLIDTALPGGLETIEVPVLVLLPEEDRIAPHEFIMELAAKLPHGEIAHLPGGHNIFGTEEGTAQVITLVVEFFGRTLRQVSVERRGLRGSP